MAVFRCSVIVCIVAGGFLWFAGLQLADIALAHGGMAVMGGAVTVALTVNPFLQMKSRLLAFSTGLITCGSIVLMIGVTDFFELDGFKRYNPSRYVALSGILCLLAGIIFTGISLRDRENNSRRAE